MTDEFENLMLDGWEDEEYLAFVDKFKTKKTTDDCYTPPEIYRVVAEWVASQYQVDQTSFVRPFYPGGDYKRFSYPPMHCGGQPALLNHQRDRAVLHAARDPLLPLRAGAHPVLACRSGVLHGPARRRDHHLRERRRGADELPDQPGAEGHPGADGSGSVPGG